MKKKTENRGGSGRNQGRKKIYDEPTKRIYITIPESKEEEIKIKLDNVLEKYKVKIKNPS